MNEQLAKPKLFVEFLVNQNGSRIVFVVVVAIFGSYSIGLADGL